MDFLLLASSHCPESGSVIVPGLAISEHSFLSANRNEGNREAAMDLSQLDLLVKVEPDASPQKVDEVNQTGDGQNVAVSIKCTKTLLSKTRKAVEKNLGTLGEASLQRKNFFDSAVKDLVKPVKILFSTVLRIHDILVLIRTRIWIRGSMSLTR
jgi:hypothetical protein